MDPGYTFGKSLELKLAIGDKVHHETYKNVDQFGGELRYFSDCILENRAPEPDAEEGLADSRVLEGILAAVKSHGPVTLPPFTRTKRIDPDRQLQELRPRKPDELIHAASPSRT
jgi:hypothetical protein